MVFTVRGVKPTRHLLTSNKKSSDIISRALCSVMVTVVRRSGARWRPPAICSDTCGRNARRRWLTAGALGKQPIKKSRCSSIFSIRLNDLVLLATTLQCPSNDGLRLWRRAASSSQPPPSLFTTVHLLVTFPFFPWARRRNEWVLSKGSGRAHQRYAVPSKPLGGQFILQMDGSRCDWFDGRLWWSQRGSHGHPVSPSCTPVVRGAGCRQDIVDGMF